MELMKNGLSDKAIQRIALAFSKVYPTFNIESFSKDVLNSYDSLELKERVNHIIAILHKQMPKDFIDTVKIFEKIPAIWDRGDSNDPLRSFAAWPIIDYIGVHGLTHPQESLAILKQLTNLFSAEFSIRPFIKEYPKVCHQQFLLWVNDESEDVRRLVSEGTRPRLPWGIRLHQFIENPNINIPLLTSLKDDSSLYVRRSVANHLNDIAKDHPELVIEVCKQWYKNANNELKWLIKHATRSHPELVIEVCKQWYKNANNELKWLIKHATRSLVKYGYTDVFPLLGFTENPQVTISELSVPANNIKLGDKMPFQFILHSNSNDKQKLVIDYAIHFVKANGKQQAKVFKLKNIVIAKEDKKILAKQFSFKPISTRKYYVGEHKLEIFVNGISMAVANFNVSSC